MFELLRDTFTTNGFYRAKWRRSHNCFCVLQLFFFFHTYTLSYFSYLNTKTFSSTMKSATTFSIYNFNTFHKISTDTTFFYLQVCQFSFQLRFQLLFCTLQHLATVLFIIFFVVLFILTFSYYLVQFSLGYSFTNVSYQLWFC